MIQISFVCLKNLPRVGSCVGTLRIKIGQVKHPIKRISSEQISNFSLHEMSQHRI